MTKASLFVPGRAVGTIGGGVDLDATGVFDDTCVLDGTCVLAGIEFAASCPLAEAPVVTPHATSCTLITQKSMIVADIRPRMLIPCNLLSPSPISYRQERES